MLSRQTVAEKELQEYVDQKGDLNGFSTNLTRLNNISVHLFSMP